MHEIYELKEMLCEELEKYGSKGDLNAGELEIVDKLAHAVKNLGKIIEMYEEEEYSGEGMSYQRGSSNRSGSYARGGSYARRRDSRGRYSSEDGYSRAAEDMKGQLRELMEQAPNEMTRRELEKLVERMEQM